MEQYIKKSALVAEIESKRKYAQTLGNNAINSSMQQFYDGMKQGCIDILSIINTLEVKECEAKSGIVQKDLQIILDDGMYIDLDPSMQLKPSFSVKEGEKVKVVISKED